MVATGRRHLCADYYRDTADARAAHTASHDTFSTDFNTFVTAATAAPVPTPPISSHHRAREVLAASFPPRPYDRNADLVIVTSRRTRFQHTYQTPPVPLEFFPDSFLHALANIIKSDAAATTEILQLAALPTNPSTELHLLSTLRDTPTRPLEAISGVHLTTDAALTLAFSRLRSNASTANTALCIAETLAHIRLVTGSIHNQTVWNALDFVTALTACTALARALDITLDDHLVIQHLCAPIDGPLGGQLSFTDNNTTTSFAAALHSARNTASNAAASGDPITVQAFLAATNTEAFRIRTLVASASLANPPAPIPSFLLQTSPSPTPRTPPTTPRPPQPRPILPPTASPVPTASAPTPFRDTRNLPCWGLSCLAAGCTKSPNICPYGHKYSDPEVPSNINPIRVAALKSHAKQVKIPAQLNIARARAWGLTYDDLSDAMKAANPAFANPPNVPLLAASATMPSVHTPSYTPYSPSHASNPPQFDAVTAFRQANAGRPDFPTWFDSLPAPEQLAHAQHWATGN